MNIETVFRIGYEEQRPCQNLTEQNCNDPLKSNSARKLVKTLSGICKMLGSLEELTAETQHVRLNRTAYKWDFSN